MESACQRGAIVTLVATVCLFFVSGVVADHGDHSDEDLSAICVIHPLDFPGINISGTIKLHQASNSNFTTVIGHLYGFENQSYSERGFHVHENGNIGGNCTAAGSHYNPLNNTHGGPTDAIRHVGDLGNINVDPNLEAVINITDSVISLRGDYSILNRAIVVHSGIDDLGMGGHETSNTTGNSGYRIGCCIIVLDQQTTSPAPMPDPTVGSGTSVGPFTGILICLAGLLSMKNIQL